MVRPSLVIACVIALGAGRAHASELPNRIGLYPNTSAGSGAALSMLDSKLEVTVRGPVVEVIVTQRFQNRTDHATEATYVFPLPPDAAVSAMAITNGNRTIRGSIEKRDEAQRRYEAAVRAGVAAALLDQERPDVFTQTVAAIPAKGMVDITLRFDTLARYQDGTWELVVPLVVAPRYVPGVATNRPTTGTGRAPDTDRAPDASRVTPAGAPGAGGVTKLTLHFVDKATDITSPTHELKLSGGDAVLTDPHSDHDAIVRWKTPATAGGWVEPAADGGYAAVVVEAPAAIARKGTVRCLLVLDRSAASRGDADAVAHPLVRALLASLGPGDRIAVTGSDQIAWSTPADVARVLEPAWHTPTGAFDLTRVLAAARPDGAPIVLVTGGLVADDAAAVAAAKRLGVAIHVLGVGPAPARGLLGQLAAVSEGTLRVAVPGDDVVAIAKAVLADAATPPLPLTVTWGALAATEVVPGTLPRIGAGQASIVLARVTRAQPANARARGELFAIETLPASRVVDGAVTAMGPLARRWARNRLDELIAAKASVAVVTAHALRYGLVSPYTSMVAIGDEVVVQGGVKRSVAIPVSVPAGMKWQAVKRETTVDLDSSSADDHPTTKQEPPAKKPPPKVSENKLADPATTPTSSVSSDSKPAPVVKGRQPRSPVAEPRRDQSPPPGATAAQRPDGDVSAGETLDEEDSSRRYKSVAAKESTADATGASIEVSDRSMARAGRLRLTTSFGGGLWRSRGETTSLLSLGARFELGFGGHTLAGADTAISVVDARDVTGHVLVSLARRGRRFELGVGFGLQLGHGAGPAGALSLRYHLPPAPRAAGYLRYDGALIFEQGDRRGESSFTLGLEWGF